MKQIPRYRYVVIISDTLMIGDVFRFLDNEKNELLRARAGHYQYDRLWDVAEEEEARDLAQ